jgi:hypothetical protein
VRRPAAKPRQSDYAVAGRGPNSAQRYQIIGAGFSLIRYHRLLSRAFPFVKLVNGEHGMPKIRKFIAGVIELIGPAIIVAVLIILISALFGSL